MSAGNRRWAGALVVPLAVLTGLLPAARPVHAQSSSRTGNLTAAQKNQVKEHYEKANRYYTVGKYPEAIVEFEAAYLIGADPVMIFNIAQSHRLNNQPEEASRFYRNYLRTNPGASNRADVEKQIAEMDRRAAEKRQSGAAAPPPPSESPAPSLPPNAGPAGPGAVTAPPPVAGSDPGSAVGMPPPPGGGSAGAAGQRPAEPAVGIGTSAPVPKVEQPSRVLPMVLMVTGGVLLSASLVMGGVAAGKAKEVEKRASPRNLPFDADTKKLEEDGKKASGAAVVAGLAGLVVGGGGLFWWLRSAPAERTVAQRGSAPVYPLAGPGLYGAGAQVSF